jgi:alkyldihydroxyacetonephosphate synthase
MAAGRLKFWGWGREDEALTSAEVSRLESAYAKRFGVAGFEAAPAPKAEDIGLRAPRVKVPGALSDMCTTDHYERLLHTYGKSFFDSARVFARDFSNPPDVVAFPRGESDLVSVLDWCDTIDAVAIPWGAARASWAGWSRRAPIGPRSRSI